MKPCTIDTVSDLDEAVQNLLAMDPRFAISLKDGGPVRLHRRESGFVALAGMIVSQQVSVAAADTIIRRLREAGLFERETISNADVISMRSCGVSGRKAEYLKSLADCEIDFSGLDDCSDEEVVRQLTGLRGIGVWTAEIYLMFSLGRRDVFPAGDLALQEAVRMLFDQPSRPTENALRKMAENWQPERSAAAHLLWNYYRSVKNREGIRV